MSTATRQPTVADQHRAVLEQCDDRVEHELRQTLSQVRTIDLASSLMGVATRVLVVVLLLALVDHWLIALPGWARLGSLVLLGLITAHGLLFRVLPLLIWRINPLYAAEQIERSVPSLKNGLINYVLLRKHPEQVHLSVLGALGRSTATRLSECDDQQVIDHGQALRSGYLLVIVFACVAIYTILSPKSPLQTLHRVLAPWGEIARPARVEFLEITPGSDEIYFSQSVNIKTQVSGVRETELVEVVFQSGTTTGPEQRVAMLTTDTSTWFELNFPPGDEGLQQDIYYRLEAGDAVSATFKLSVLPTPTIVIKEITYTYPRYTGLKRRTVKDKADIRAVEGTRVSIVGRANGPILSANLKLFTSEASRPLPRAMGVDNDDNQLAANELLLKLLADHRTAEFQGYELEFTNSEKQRSSSPIRHRITVTPDFAPEIELLEPQRPSVEVPINGSLAVEVRAIDPDYGLSRVAVENTSNLPNITLLSDSKGLDGQFLKRFSLVPARLGLKVGDTYTFQLVAEDNRHDPFDKPEPNRSSTHSVTIEVTAADSNNSGRRPTEMNDPVDPDKPEDGDKPSDGDQGDSVGEPESGDQGDGAGEPESGDQGDAGDGGTPTDGDKPETGDQPGDGNDPKPGDQPQAGDNPKPGDQPQAGDDPQPGDQPQAGDNSEQGGDNKPAAGGDENDPNQPADGGQQDKPADGNAADEQDSDAGDPHDGDVIQRVLDRIKKEKQQQLDGGGDQQDSADGDPGNQVGEQAGSQGSEGNDPSGNNDKPASAAGGEGGKPSGESADGDKKPAGNADPDDKPTDRQRKPGAGQDGDGNQRPAEGEKPGDNSSTAKKPGENPTGTPADGDKPAAGEDGDGNDADKPAAGDQPDEGGDSKPGEEGNDAPKPTDKPGQGNPDDQRQGEGADGDQESASTPGEEGDKGQPDAQEVKSNSSSVANNAGTASSGAAGSSAPGQSNDNPSGMGESGNRQPDAHATGQQESEKVSNDVVGLPDNIPESDEARLDYAEKATNLVLEYLKDQQHDPDPELLKESGLSAEQLREMVSRYERLKRNAETSAEGQRDLEEALRSLGLNPRSGRSARQYRRPERLIEGVSNAGTRSQPPAGLLDKFNAFKKGTALSDE